MTITTYLTANGEMLQNITFLALFLMLGLAEWRGRRPANLMRRRSRWPANLGLTALNILILSVLPVTAVGAAVLAQANGWGLLNAIEAPFAAAVVLALVGRSLVAYGVHLAMHKVPVLWRVHRVHHLDREMDVTTTVRFHPLEIVIQAVPGVLAIALLGLPPAAVIAYEILDAGMAVFTHWNLRLPERFDRALRLVLVTPNMHRIHHSAHQPETDSNYGALLSWWDRLFGTHVRAPRDGYDAMAIGLKEVPDRRADGLPWLLVSPVFGRLASSSA